MEQLTQLGVGGMFAVMLVQLVLTFLGKRGNGGLGNPGHKIVEKLDAMNEKLSDIQKQLVKIETQTARRPRTRD